MLNVNQHKTLPNLNQSFLDRLRSYRTLIARQEPQLYENAVLDNELQSNLGKIAQLSKKYNKLQKSIDKSRDNAVSLNTAKKLFPGTFEYIQGQEKLLKKISNIKGENLEVIPLEVIPTNINYFPLPILDRKFPSISNITARTPMYKRNYDSKILDKYIQEINQKIGENGYISGSTPLIHKYNLPDVPGDLEITTTPERLNNLLKSLNLDRNQATIVNDNNLQTLRFSNFQDGINNSLDIDVIMPNGRMAHQIWSAQDPAAYSKWLQTQSDNIPLSSEELFQLGRKDPANISLYDLIKRRGKDQEQIEKINNRSWSLLTPENLKNLSQVHTNIAKTYHPQYKTFKEQFPDFDYANIEANKKLLNELGYDPRFAENPENMQDLLEILNSNQLMGRQVRPNEDIPFEEMEKSLWSPYGGTASGAGGNTTNGFIGAEGYAGNNGAVGILQNVRTGDPLRNSEDYLKQFQLERFEDNNNFLIQDLPEKMQQDLSKFNIKTNLDLDSNLRGLDPNSELGKQIYPILDKYGYRSTISTRAFNKKGDGSFYVGNLNPKATVTSYPISKIPYIELPHHNAMYTDVYNVKTEQIPMDLLDVVKFNEIKAAAQKSLLNKERRKDSITDKVGKLVGHKTIEFPSKSWSYFDKKPLIDKENKIATGILTGVSGLFGGIGYKQNQDSKEFWKKYYEEQKLNNQNLMQDRLNQLLKADSLPPLNLQFQPGALKLDDQLENYFKINPHPYLNAKEIQKALNNEYTFESDLKDLEAYKRRRNLIREANYPDSFAVNYIENPIFHNNNHPILNSLDLYRAPYDSTLYMDLLNKLKASKNK